MGVEVSLPEAMGTIKVHALKDLTGDAEVTTMRNKKKYLFDFEFTLEWRGELKDIGPCKGTLKYVKLRQHASNCVTLLLSLEKHVWAPPPLDPLPPTHPKRFGLPAVQALGHLTQELFGVSRTI